MVECALALGFDQMAPGALKQASPDRPAPMANFIKAMTDIQGYDEALPRAAQLFGGAGRTHMMEYGTRPETFARIAVKARRHAARNPFALFREALSEEQILASSMIFDPLTRYQCCPPTCGVSCANTLHRPRSQTCCPLLGKSVGISSRRRDGGVLAHVGVGDMCVALARETNR